MERRGGGEELGEGQERGSAAVVGGREVKMGEGSSGRNEG